MLTISFDPFPVLTTPRLTLRPFTQQDAPDLFILRSDPEIMQYIPRPLAVTVADSEQQIERVNAGTRTGDNIDWAITLTGEDKAIGSIAFFNIKKEHHRAEIGYLIHKDYHGKGLMQEALATVIDYGFDVLRLHSMEAVVDPDNIASIRLLEKNGFVREAHFKEDYFYNGKFLDSVIYSLLTPHS